MAEARSRYRAFISYSQRDMTAAQRLHKALENYRVPLGISPDLVKSKRRLLGRFFRDVEDMSAASDISATVRGAIEDSESLIVLCSPRSAQSRWVDTEVQHFRATGRGHRIFAVILDGEPNSSDPATECFPPSLRLDAGPDLHPDDMPVEPVGIDMRVDSLERVCSRIAAGLLGVPFDALWQRRRREAIRQWWIRGGVAFAITLLAFAAVVGIGAGQVRRTLETRSTLLAAQSQAAMDAGEEIAAARYAAAGVMAADMPFFSFNASAAEAALRRALSGAFRYRLENSDSIIFSPTGDRLVSIDTENLRTTLRDARTGRLIGDLTSPNDFVASAFSPDGAHLLLGGLKGAALLTDARTGKMRRRLPALSDAVTDVAFSSDGARLLLGDGRTVAIHTVSDATPLATIALTTPGLGAWFGARGAEVLTVESDGAVRRWRASDGAALGVWRTQAATSAFVSKDGARVLAISSDGEEIGGAARLHDIAGRLIASWPERAAVSAGAFSDDGAHLVLVGEAGPAELWDARRGRLIRRLELPKPDPQDDGGGHSAGFTPDGAYAITTARTAPVTHLWSLRGGHVYLRSQRVTGSQNLALSADGSLMALTGDDGITEVWRTFADRHIETVGKIATLPPGDGRTFIVAGQGRRFLATDIDRETRVVDPFDTTAQRRFPGGSVLPAASADAALVATVSDDRVALWDAVTGTRIAADRAAGGTVLAVGFSRDVPLALVRRESGAVVIAGAVGVEIAALEMVDSAVTDFAFDATGAFLISRPEDATVRVWRTADGREIAALAGKIASQGAVDESADGRLILGEDPDPGDASSRLRVFDLRDGRIVQTWTAPDLVGQSLFSPDGRVVATAVADFSVRLWRVDTGAETVALRGFNGQISDFAFSPDGRLIATFGLDDFVRVWDVASGAMLMVHALGGTIDGGAFTVDGRALAVLVSNEQDARDFITWRLPESFTMERDALIRQACSVTLANGAGAFRTEELSRLGAARRKNATDACRAPTFWDRVAQAIGF